MDVDVFVDLDGAVDVNSTVDDDDRGPRERAEGGVHQGPLLVGREEREVNDKGGVHVQGAVKIDVRVNVNVDVDVGVGVLPRQ